MSGELALMTTRRNQTGDMVSKVLLHMMQMSSMTATLTPSKQTFDWLLAVRTFGTFKALRASPIDKGRFAACRTQLHLHV